MATRIAPTSRSIHNAVLYSLVILGLGSLLAACSSGSGSNTGGNNTGGAGGSSPNIRSLAVGSDHACLTNKDWEAECWGYNFWGQVGLPSSSGLDITQRNRITFPPGKHLVRKIVAGRAHTCAIVDESTNNVAKNVYCWGSNEFGQLGDDGFHLVSSSPVEVDFSAATPNPVSIKRVVDLAAGADHTCAVLETKNSVLSPDVRQEIWCWGKNDQSQLALPGIQAPYVSKPTVKSAFVGNEVNYDFFVFGFDFPSVPTHTEVTSIAAGSNHTCVDLIRVNNSRNWEWPNISSNINILVPPSTFCWGRNSELQLAYNGLRPIGATLYNFDPPNHVQQISYAQVAGEFSKDSNFITINRGITVTVESLYAGGEVTCAHNSIAKGVPECWGNNQFQQVTNDSSIPFTRFVFQNDIGATEDLAIGKNHLCATGTSTTSVKCKGGNSAGQLGIGVADALVYPVAQTVQKEDGTPLIGMTEIDAGDSFTCATDGQQVYCWGDNTHGQIGVDPSVAAVVTKARALRETVTLAPASPTVGNCFPFGMGSPTGGGSSLPWTPFGVFVYQNVPPFNLQIGDAIAFDLGAPNDATIQLEIAMAASTVNGGNTPAGSFIKVVSNTQTPMDPDGDAIVGNYELQFTAEAPFSFPGGGLLVRFSAPSASYQADNTCTQVLVKADATDTSGLFVRRVLRDADGMPPWDEADTSSIGALRIIPQ